MPRKKKMDLGDLGSDRSDAPPKEPPLPFGECLAEDRSPPSPPPAFPKPVEKKTKPAPRAAPHLERYRVTNKGRVKIVWNGCVTWLREGTEISPTGYGPKGIASLKEQGVELERVE